MHSIWIAIFWTSAAALAYALVGYGLLLRFLSRLARGRRTEPHSPDHLPTVTLVIPAHNEEELIKAKLENSLEIDYPRQKLQILVASDDSTDRTVQIARSFEKQSIRVLAFTERRGKTAVLNDAVREAAGEVLCVCDANVMFRADALRKLVARLDDPRIGAVSGDVRLASEESDFGEGESAYYRVERQVQLAESRVGSMMGVDGGMYVVRRELFQPPAPDTIVDDFVISMRVIRQGKRVVYEPAAIATENGTATARQEFQRRIRLSAGAMQVLKRGERPPLRRPVELWQFVSHKVIRWAGPAWLVLLFVSSGVLARSAPTYRAALLAQVLFYCLAAAGILSTRFRRTRIGGPAFYFVMSHIAMAVGLVKGLLNLQEVAWDRTERTPPKTGIEATPASRYANCCGTHEGQPSK